MSGNGYEIEAEFTWDDAEEFGLKVCQSDREETVIDFETASRFLYIERTRSGESGFYEAFPCKHGAAVKTEGKRLKLRVFVDQSSVEVIADDGRLVITDLIFPDRQAMGWRFTAKAWTCR